MQYIIPITLTWRLRVHIHSFHGYVYLITIGCGVRHTHTIYTKDAKQIELLKYKHNKYAIL
jgi:hypothetical protein